MQRPNKQLAPHIFWGTKPRGKSQCLFLAGNFFNKIFLVWAWLTLLWNPAYPESQLITDFCLCPFSWSIILLRTHRLLMDTSSDCGDHILSWHTQNSLRTSSCLLLVSTSASHALSPKCPDSVATKSRVTLAETIPDSCFWVFHMNFLLYSLLPRTLLTTVEDLKQLPGTMSCSRQARQCSEKWRGNIVLVFSKRMARGLHIISAQHIRKDSSREREREYLFSW